MMYTASCCSCGNRHRNDLSFSSCSAVRKRFEHIQHALQATDCERYRNQAFRLNGRGENEKKKKINKSSCFRAKNLFNIAALSDGKTLWTGVFSFAVFSRRRRRRRFLSSKKSATPPCFSPGFLTLFLRPPPPPPATLRPGKRKLVRLSRDVAAILYRLPAFFFSFSKKP